VDWIWLFKVRPERESFCIISKIKVGHLISVYIASNEQDQIKSESVGQMPVIII
jgi:hypothetical protein